MNLYREIENSFPTIEKLFTKEDLLEFKNAPLADLYLYHFGLGTWIRDNLLFSESLLYNLFLENGIENPDAMSGLVIKQFHCYLSHRN